MLGPSFLNYRWAEKFILRNKEFRIPRLSGERMLWAPA